MKHLLGTFWSNIINDSIIDNLFSARIALNRQNIYDADVILNILSRVNTPIFRVVQWHIINIEDISKTEVQLPNNIRNIRVITDRLLKPTKVWLLDFDFYKKDNILVFRKPLNIDNKSILLWAHDVEIDEYYLNNTWGVVLGLECESSKTYKELLHNIYDWQLTGLTIDKLINLCGIIFNSPIAKYNESVEVVHRGTDTIFVATATTVYENLISYNSLVKTGDVLEKNKPLFDDIKFYKPGERYLDNIVPENTLYCCHKKNICNELINLNFSKILELIKNDGFELKLIKD